MSHIVKTENKFCHVVENKDGKFYYVFSGNPLEAGYQTWVCGAEKGQFDYYTDWDEIYVEKHKDMNELEYRHLYVARNIEEVLEKGADV